MKDISDIASEMTKKAKEMKDPIISLNKDLIVRIVELKIQKVILDSKRKEYSEQVKGVADTFGTSSAKISKLINLLLKEEESGGIIQEETMVLDWAEQFQNNNK